jgi:glyoxylase-like metal-dependent hydrolase (beta-lactamase superfamily II)
MNRILYALCFLGLIISNLFGRSADMVMKSRAHDIEKTMVFVTIVSNHEQSRSVMAMVKSIRELSGDFRNSKIFVVRSDPENFPCTALVAKGVELVQLEMDKSFMDYPLAMKAFAAAQVERAIKGKAGTLTWLDPGVLVLDSPDDLSLGGNFDCAIRPVSLSNTIGLLPGQEPDAYWKPIYIRTGINFRELPVVETVVDKIKIQPYYNCEVFSVNPELGICGEWAKLLSDLLKDGDYQKVACLTFLKRLFLHQAVLSAVITSRIKPDRIKALPISCAYPFNQRDRLASEKRIPLLNDLSVVIFDYAWENIPNWMDQIKIQEPLRRWLFDTYLDYMKLTDSLYRMEGSCNSYLVVTEEGSVLIDPAGAASAPEFFKSILKKFPLKAILLTHAHQDHWEHMDIWRTDPEIPIIAQREFMKYIAYRKRMSAFFARREAIWARKPLPGPDENAPFQEVIPSVTFADAHTYVLSGLHFEMKHTPGETPDHATIWIPELKAVFVGDNYYEYFINNATLRGTITRPVSGYIEALTLALSYRPEYFLMGHGSPVVTGKIIRETVSGFRDALQYIYDETIKGINEGKDVYELMRKIKVPDKYKIRPYFGKVEWTVRGIFHETVGWFDENSASMYSLPASAIYSDLVGICGADSLINRAEEYISHQEFVKALHLTDVVLASNPDHQQANEIRLKALESLKSRTFNYIERIWLDYGIRIAKEKIGLQSPPARESR